MSEPLKISVHVEEKRYQPTQEKTVVPGWDAKTVTPDKGYALSKVTVEGMPEPTQTETFTENGEYNVGRIGTAIVDVGIDLQNKTVTPTEQTQTVEADTGYDGLDTVTVNPIPPEYVVPTGSVDITQNGQGIDVAGKATANVNVPQGVFPSGTKLITQNVTGEDVTNYAAVNVAVPGPSGTKQINITANGTTTEDVTDYANAEITVNTLPAKGLVFDDYDSDGYPHSARFVGTWTKIPDKYMSYLQQSKSIMYKLSSISIPDTVSTIGTAAFERMNYISDLRLPNSDIIVQNVAFTQINISELRVKRNISLATQAFDGLTSLTHAYFGGEVDKIANQCFRNAKLEFIDFSHCTAIPPLYSVVSLGHAPGCGIRIPAALSDTTLGEGNGFESETNWSALTDIVWEVV